LVENLKAGVWAAKTRSCYNTAAAAATVAGGHEPDPAEGVRRDGHRAAGRPPGRVQERELRAGAGGQDTDVEADHPVLGAAGVHPVRGPVERHARPPPPAAHVHTHFRAAADGRVQRAERVQLALVAGRGRGVRVPGARAHRFQDMLRGRRRVLRGRHHPRPGPDQAHRHAHVAVLHRHAGGRVHGRLPERQHRLLRHVRRVHSDERGRAGAGRGPGQGHVRAVRRGRVHLADGQPQGDRRLGARAGQETSQPVAARLHDHRVAAHRRAHARCVSHTILLIFLLLLLGIKY